MGRGGADVTTRAVVLAGGGVLWRGEGANLQVALVHRPEYDDWSLPKGKTDAGEHLLVTAVREVEEETGRRGELGPYLTTVRYRVTSGGKDADKEVTYWSMRAAAGTFAPTKEVDAMTWLSVEEARPVLTSAPDRAVLDAFVRAPVGTQALLLVRSGRDEADALRPVLEALGVGALVCADRPGAEATLVPYAESAGLTVRCDPLLTREAFADAPEAAAAAAAAVRRDATGARTAVCVGRTVLPGLLAALTADVEVAPPEDVEVSPGGFWLLHHREGVVTAYERHDLET